MAHHSDRDWFKRGMEILTLAVIIGGLYFAWDQANKLTESIRLNNTATNISTWLSVSNQSIEADKVFVQNPEFQKYFLDGVAISEDHPDYPKARAIAFLMLDYAEGSLTTVGYLHENLPEAIVEKQTWEKYFNSLFKSSPLMCKLYRENTESFGTTLRRNADAACGTS